MEGQIITQGRVESLSAPRHVAGPINGNPYALVDRRLFYNKPAEHEQDRMHKSPENYKSHEVSKGINDLDNLLNELGFLSSSCKQDSSQRIEMDENSNLAHLPDSDSGAMVTTTLPTINVCSDSSKDISTSHVYSQPEVSQKGLGKTVTTEIRVKPHLPARTSSFGAVSRHQRGSLDRSVSEDTKVPKIRLNRNQSVGCDDVFNSEGPISPTVSEMLTELSHSPRSPSQQNWSTKAHNFSTNYDNIEGHRSVSSADNADAGEFRQGRVKDHVKQFNKIVSSPDPSKVGTGVPMPGLVQGIDFEDKISKFNYRSLAPGQRGPAIERIYMAGSPPKRIVYENEQDTVAAAEGLFIPSYADRPVEYYLHERERSKQERGTKMTNGHIPSREENGERFDYVVKHSNEVDYGRIDDEVDDMHHPRSDSAYGESMRSSSAASTTVASSPAAPSHSPKTENDRESHSSSVTSFNDDDSSGYARIEDMQIVKKNTRKSPPPVIVEPEGEVVQEQEVIAVSHTVPVESFPDRLNKRMPDIKSRKDLSLAVYQSNYLPGLTNGQPTVLSSGQIEIEDGSIQSEAGRSSAETMNGHVSGPLTPDKAQVFDSDDVTKKGAVGSNGGLGPGIHLVESPPSPCFSGRSDSSSTAQSPTRRTLRHRLKRSNSSTSSLSSSELFPEVTRHPHVKFDKDTLNFWYKPKITRDEAISLLKDKAPGTFVVRDSQSYEGAFGLAVKVATPPLGVIQQAGGDISKINMENELIRHFLIEPCKQGVRLKGSNNEPAFPSLVALIFQHSVTKMALPTELALPKEDIDTCDEVDGKNGLTEQQVLQQGAACNLVYLASIDVEGLSGDGAVKYAINKVLSTNYTVKSTVVKIKVDQDGLTLTDNERRLFFRKHYVVKDVLHCIMDPRGRRFNLQNVISDASHQAPCFGVVVCKPQQPLQHECIVFAEIEPSQPASAVIDFIHRVIKNGKK